LTLRAYRELGGVEGALAQRAQDAFDALSPTAQDALPRVFRELLTVGEGKADRPTRKQAALDAFGAADGSSPSRELVDKFVAERLLTAKGGHNGAHRLPGKGKRVKDVGWDEQTAAKVGLRSPAEAVCEGPPIPGDLIPPYVAPGEVQGTAAVEIAHEALLSHWQPLVQWLEHDRELLRVRGRIAAAAARWDQEGRQTDRLLPTGKPLDEANQLAAAGFDLNPLERDYIAASRALARRRRNVRRLAIAALVMLAVSASLAALVANRMRHDAEEARAAIAVQKTAADEARQAAEQQRSEADRQRQIAEKQTQVARQNEDSANKAKADALARKQEAEQQRQIAQSQTVAANQQRQIAEQQRSLAERNLQFNRVALAARDLEGNDGGQARELLDAYPAAMRQWEWNYVNRLCHGERMTLRQPDCVYSVAFSPRADKLVTAGSPLYENGGDVRVWETQTGRLVCTFKGHHSSPRQAIFLADGKRVLSASQDEVILWNAQDGSIIKQLSLGSFRPEAITFNKDGSLVAVADNSTYDLIHVHIYGVATGTETRTINIRPPASAPQPASGSSSDQPPRPVYIDVTAMAFGLDGRRLATVHNQRSVKLWDLTNGTEVRDFSEGDTIILDAALSDDGTQLACGRLDGTTPVWDTDSGRRLFILGGHNSAVSQVVFSRDRIATASWDQSAKVWDARTGVESFTIRGHANWVTGVAISRSGGSIATSSWDGTAKIWDGYGQGIIPKRVDGGPHWLEGVAFHPNGRSVADARTDESVWVWSINGDFPEATFSGERFVAYNNDGSLIATRGARDKANLLQVFNAHGNNDEPKLVYRGHTASVNSTAFRPHSTQLASASSDGTVKVWDDQGKEVFTCRGHSAGVADLVYSADGQWIVSGGFDKTLRVWDADSGKPVRVFQGHPGSVTSVAVSTDKSMVAAAGGTFNQPGQATVWDAASGKVLWELRGHSNEVSCVLFSLNGKRIFTGSYDKSVKIWDTESGQEALTLRGHAREVTALALSADGNLLASAGRDGTVRIWDGTPVPPKIANFDQLSPAATVNGR
jgi:WD40 repeat protein